MSPALSPRRAALLLTGLLLLSLLALDPGVRPEGAPRPASPDVRLLESSSSWADRAALADPAPLVLPELGLAPALPDSAQPDATPFAAYPPLLRSSPEGTLQAPLEHTVAPWVLADPRQLPESDQPLRTLGQRPAVAPPPPLGPNCRILRISGQPAVEQLTIAQGEELHKLLSENNLNIDFPLIFTLAIDEFGLQARPVMGSLTGSDKLNQAAIRWVETQAWAARLRPGAYRLEIRP